MLGIAVRRLVFSCNANVIGVKEEYARSRYIDLFFPLFFFPLPRRTALFKWEMSHNQTTPAVLEFKVCLTLPYRLAGLPRT